ncbi:MAG TPA: hypothetical protein VK897_26960 [Anaerolineales bacterium]|nr:hypothetical protein [Anaerolineales bacterium]
MFAKLRVILSVFGLLAVLTACGPAPALEPTSPPPSPVAQSSPTPEATTIIEPGLVAGFDCQNVSDIPTEECQGLLALYASTNGDNWEDNSGWLVDPSPCTWYGVSCGQGHVVELQLFYNGLVGSLPPEIGNFSHLKNLYLDDNDLSGPLPEEIGNLTELQLARLSQNGFDSIPAELMNLQSLMYLELWGNRLSGEIPDEISMLSSLQELRLGFNQFTGSLPPELGNLAFLHVLDLSHNRLSGSIPASLGDLASLNQLDLSFNELSGPIPVELADLANLYWLDLSYNQLTGEVPAAIAQATRSERRLWGNLLEGTVEASEGITPVEYQDAQLEFSSDLASSVWPETVPPERGTADAPGWLVWPEHTRFTFAYPRRSGDLEVSRFAAAFGPPRVMIYPAQEYAEMSEFAKTEIEELQSLLQTRPPAIEGEMPALPLINAAQVFHAQVEYLDFQNGQGVRFISQYSQDISPVFNQSLFYTFQGLTNDGAYYVAAFFPLAAEELPDDPFVEDYDAFSARYQDYLNETISQLDSFSADQFDPDLDVLDDVIQSLAVDIP